MTLRKGHMRLIRLLRKDAFQHLALGFFTFCVVFSLFAIQAWFQGRASLLETLNYQRLAFWLVFREAVIFILAMGIPVYINLIVGYPIARRRWGNWGFYFFLLFNLLNALISGLLLPFLFRWTLDLPSLTWYETAIIAFILILITSGVSFTKEILDRQRALERKERQDAIRKRRDLERELNYIRKQIRPHFLFNTLANLQILAHRQSPELPRLIGELSRLLRHLVYRTNERLASLEDEIGFIQSYIALQKLQLAKDTEFEFEIQGQVREEHRIAPMILLLVVENCFKHYNQKGPGDRWIRIHLTILEDSLELATSNSYKPNARNEDNFSENNRGGVGWASLRENLELIYYGQYQFETEFDRSRYAVRLKLPLL